MTEHMANTASATQQDGWLDLARLSEYASVSTRTLRRWIAQRDNPLPAYRRGGKIFVSRKAYDSWLKSQPLETDRAQVASIVNSVMAKLAG